MQEAVAGMGAETRGLPVGFPIVGLGASAGGVEAVQQFLQSVPLQCGMAFVVVQHMDPSHDGVLVEILQRSTPMPVLQITDKMKVEPEHVYVVPPNCDLSILNGELLLLQPVAQSGPRLPIDFFFRALAADMRERCIGVILSGMGSDGTLGLRAIREASGSVFVQEPCTAAFDSMPRSAISAGLEDVVGSPHELASRILSYRSFAPWRSRRASEGDSGDDASNLDKIIAILRVQTGQDFSLYKRSTISRRIERRMALHQLSHLSEYLQYLRQYRQESKLLFKELLIGVTRFFRDPDVWEQLKVDAIPTLLAGFPEGGTLRAWVPACSTGEEAYTLAIIFREALEEVGADVSHELQIFATDLDEDAIQTARAGLYPLNISADVSEVRLQRHFVREDGAYRISREIRGMVIFSQQNVVMDPPFTGIDLLSCRNLLIYLESYLQRKLLPLFHYSLRTNGILVLGSSESTGESTALFTTLPGNSRIYQRRNISPPYDPVDFPPVFSRPRSGVSPVPLAPSVPSQKSRDMFLLTNELLLQSFAPSAILTSEQGVIVYICGAAGKYLEPGAGQASLSIFSMAKKGLAAALNEVFSKAVREKCSIQIQSVKIGAEPGLPLVDVSVQPLSLPQALRGMVLVVFQEVAASRTAAEAAASPQQDRLEELGLEMQHVRDELQSTRDAMQTSEEELKASNEELQSTNEELQSANEELTTSKEEMQSMNEELQSVNRELSSKVDEMSQASDDMKNLLNSTAIATLFLDDRMQVRRFTTQASALFKLIASDVGRPITDLASSLHYPELANHAHEVLRTLVFKEVRVAGEGGRWFNVRIMPYRTQDNRIDGVVITFVDITQEKSLEVSMQKALETLALDAATPAETLGKLRSLLQGWRDLHGTLAPPAH